MGGRAEGPGSIPASRGLLFCHNLTRKKFGLGVDFGVDLGSLWVIFRVVLGWLGGRLGVVWGSFWDRCGIVLRQVLDRPTLRELV